MELVIDRSQAPKNVGTLKDISLYGSFSFPTEGEHTGGIIARSLCNAGKVLKKTKAQVRALCTPTAGQTGSSVKELLPSQTPYNNSLAPDSNYCIRFIQHAPEPAVLPKVSKISIVHPHKDSIRASGYAIKTGGAIRTTFSKEQKEVMIEYYDQQAHHSIKATPRDCQETMKQRGLEVLTEKQIRNWWSTYHRKRREEVLSARQEITGTMPCQSSHSII